MEYHQASQVIMHWVCGGNQLVSNWVLGRAAIKHFFGKFETREMVCRVVQDTFLLLYSVCLCVSLISQEKVSESSPLDCIGQTHRMSSLVSLSASLSDFSQFLILVA